MNNVFGRNAVNATAAGAWRTFAKCTLMPTKRVRDPLPTSSPRAYIIICRHHCCNLLACATNVPLISVPSLSLATLLSGLPLGWPALSFLLLPRLYTCNTLIAAIGPPLRVLHSLSLSRSLEPIEGQFSPSPLLAQALSLLSRHVRGDGDTQQRSQGIIQTSLLPPPLLLE